MVGFAQPGWPVATGEGASSVAGHQRPADAHRDGALGAAEVEGLAVAAQHDGDHLAIARHAAGVAGADELPVVQHGGAQPDQHPISTP